MSPAAEPSRSDAAVALSTERLATILTFLVTFAYIDGDFAIQEKQFIAAHMDALLTMLTSGSTNPAERAQLRTRCAQQLELVFAQVSAELAALAEETYREGMGRPGVQRSGFVYTRLKTRCVELMRAVSVPDRNYMLSLIDGLMHADGRLDPAEVQLRQDLLALAALDLAPPAVGAAPPLPVGPGGPPPARPPMGVIASHWNPPKAEDPPVLRTLEQAFSPHPVELRSQLLREHARIVQTLETWNRQRERGNGGLAGRRRVAELPEGSAFLDNYVYALRTQASRPLDLVVIGDLHGCYSCLKAALLQSDFFRRAWLHQHDPANNRDIKLVFLGDYIDRGRFSFDGVLRVVLQIFVLMPDYVYVLRGNHEHYVRGPSGIYSAVYPAEALATLAPHAPHEILEAYRVLFDAMPTSLICDRTMFVHGGIPRDDTFAERFRDLSSLNDPDLRFQMMWSDPAQTDFVPVALQRENPRFSFGKQQFRGFMDAVGCRTMVRGHERIPAGFAKTYDLGDMSLLTVFSAGGAYNSDLPEDSSYRQVSPMAVTLRLENGFEVANPWPINYATFSYSPHNGLLRPAPLIEPRTG